MVFDSRKFPERKELWDGFVLSVTANIMHNKYKEISDKIENKERTNEILEMAEQIPLLSVASKIIKKIINGDGGSWVKRIDEYQKLLEEIIKKVAINREYTKWSEVYNNIYIILEDVDRSGQEWIYFLETLNNFIKSLDIDVIHSRIICICPIAEENLEANFQKYLKVFDYYDFFKPYINTVNFIDNLFNKKVLTKEQKPIVLKLINSLLLEEPKNTMREVKFIFRTAYSHYLETKKDVDWFVYFLAQIYRRWKNYPQYEIDNKRKEEVKKGIKKKSITIWSIMDSSMQWTSLEKACIRWIIKWIHELKPAIPQNLIKIQPISWDTISYDNDILSLPVYYFE